MKKGSEGPGKDYLGFAIENKEKGYVEYSRNYE